MTRPDPARETLPRRLPRTPSAPGEEPAVLDDTRRAIQEARAAGAEHLGAYQEAVAGLRLAEALHLRGAPPGQVVATARRALDAAREAQRALAPPATPLPSRTARPPVPVPTPTPTPQLRAARIRPTPRPTPRPTRAAMAPTPALSPEPTPPGTRETPEPVPTPDLASRHVLVLRSSSEVWVYRAVTGALVRELPGRVAVQDLSHDQVGPLDVQGEPADLVVAVGAAAATAARQRITDRPVIFCAALNPERYQLSTPNMGGVSFEPSAGEQLHRLKEALPGVQRIGIIHNPQVSGAFVRKAEQAAEDLGLRLVAAVAWEPRDVGFVFQSLRKHIDLLWMIPDPAVLTRESFEVLRLQTAEAGIPFVSYAELFARKGALLAFYPDPDQVGSQCADLATRVLAGKIMPREVGIRPPEQFRVAVNRLTEKLLGIDVAPDLETDIEIR